MTQSTEQFLQQFFQRLNLKYNITEKEHVNLYTSDLAERDPIEQLKAAVDWAEGRSAQLMSGFRGTGKSTELRRLQRMLKEDGAAVLFVDMADYLNLSDRVDVVDFLLSVAGAFGEALEKDEFLGKGIIKEGYFQRAVHFMTRTEVNLTELGLEGGGASLRGTLKDNPSFRRKLQESLAAHLSQLTDDVHEFIKEGVELLRKKREAPLLRVVLILDSIEQIRGTSVNAEEVAAAIENLFLVHADKLHFPDLHVIYTVPPWLKIKAPGADAHYDGFQQIPCVKVCTQLGVPHPPAIAVLKDMVRRRGDWEKLLGDPRLMDQLVLISGGYLRDLMRLLQATLRYARGGPLPIPSKVVVETMPDGTTVERVAAPAVDRAIDEVRAGYLPMPISNAQWLAKVHKNKEIVLSDKGSLPDLARLFDHLLVMVYRNGTEWFDIHPLVREEVKRMTTALVV